MRLGAFAALAVSALNEGQAEFFVASDMSDLPSGADAGDAIDLDFDNIGKVRARVLGFKHGEPHIAVDAIDYLDKFVGELKKLRAG